MEIVDQPNTFNRPMPKLRGIALPTEHGGWGFLLEPLVGGLFVAFSPAAPYIALLMIGAFLTRQPLKVLSGDLLARRDLPQTRIAAKFVVGYGALALVGLVGMLYFAPAAAFLPLVAVSPLAAAQIFAEIPNEKAARC